MCRASRARPVTDERSSVISSAVPTERAATMSCNVLVHHIRGNGRIPYCTMVSPVNTPLASACDQTPGP